MISSVLFAPGSVHWEPAESGSQQAVGCCGGIPARFRQHADEVIPGIDCLSALKQLRCYVNVRACATFVSPEPPSTLPLGLKQTCPHPMKNTTGPMRKSCVPFSTSLNDNNKKKTQFTVFHCFHSKIRDLWLQAIRREDESSKLGDTASQC